MYGQESSLHDTVLYPEGDDGTWDVDECGLLLLKIFVSGMLARLVLFF